MRPDRRLARHARLAPSVALGTLTALCAVAQAALLAQVITGSYGVLPLLAGVFLLRALLVWGGEVAAHRAAAGAISSLRAALLGRVVAGGRDGAGEVAVLATRGVDALEPYFARYLPQLLLSVIVPVVVLVALAAADPTAASIVAVTLPLIPLFGALIGSYVAARTRRQWRVLARLAGHFADVVAGLTTLKVFGRARAQVAAIERIGGEHRDATMATLRIAFCSALVLELAATLSVALVAVSVGLRLLGGHLTLRTALFVLILTPEAYLALRQAAAQFHAAQEGLAAADDIFGTLDAPAPAGRGGRPIGSAREITAERVVVRDLPPVSVTLTPGTVTALAGPSGAGKSSFVAALLRFAEPSGGLITVDGTPLAATDPDAWRRLIAWVPQRPYVFEGTVADNIAIAVPGASQADVRAAAETMGVLGFTDLDAPGGELSAGQRQRVALARAVLRCRVLNTPVLLLDEPTAHLDLRTELDVLDGIDALLTGRTTLIVTHRRAPLDRADQVIRLDLKVPA